jgi:drug/metabolite transporter (DMT)-like permease
MNRLARPPLTQPPATWAVVLAFGLLYTSWSTTYFAIRQGVHAHHLPPGLFGGVRVGLAGVILLAYLWLVDPAQARLTRRELTWIAAAGLLLFVGGNGLMTVGLDKLPSGIGAVFTAATPLWMALIESLWPAGDKLTGRGWVGLLAGLGGVAVLIGPQLGEPRLLLENTGPLILCLSTILWAMGSLVVRYRQRGGSHLAAAAYQMIIGGGTLALVGLAAGEGSRLTPGLFTPGAIASFVYLLIVGSLVGFTAFNWLLGHVRATLVGTYAYVNPVLAVVIGWLLGGETITVSTLIGMGIILTGVALVRSAARRRPAAASEPTAPSPAVSLAAEPQSP